MKTIVKKMTVVFATALFMTGCNQSKNDCPCNEAQKEIQDKTEIVTVKEDEQQSPTEKATAKYDAQESLRNKSVEYLVKGYVANEKNVKQQSLYLDQLYNVHELCDYEYVPFRDAFWNPDRPFIGSRDVAELRRKMKGSKPTDYLQFTFGSGKTTKDMTYNVVNKHVFNSFVSCFSAVLINDILDNTHVSEIFVTKGIEHIDSPNPWNIPLGDYYIAMLVVTYDNSPTRYFDIVKDPTVGVSTPLKDCSAKK